MMNSINSNLSKTNSDSSFDVTSETQNHPKNTVVKIEIADEDECNGKQIECVTIKQEVDEFDNESSELKTGEVLIETKFADFDHRREDLHCGQEVPLANTGDLVQTQKSEPVEYISFVVQEVEEPPVEAPPKPSSFPPYWTPYERAKLSRRKHLYACQICSIVFEDSSEARHHVNHDHPVVKNRTCERCGQTFQRRTEMLQHRRTMKGCATGGSKDIVCRFCDKTFPCPSALKRHAAIHAEEDPDFQGYTCELCGKAFTKLVEFKKHKDRHKGIRLFKCSGCGKAFSDKSGRNRHERSDVCPNQMVICCVVCDEEFSNVMHLAKHVCPGAKKET